jgi:hypothetical protein
MYYDQKRLVESTQLRFQRGEVRKKRKTIIDGKVRGLITQDRRRTGKY